VIGFSGCADRALARFFRGDRVQERCAPQPPFILPSDPVPASLADVLPARGVAGRRGRVVTAVALTVGDMLDELVRRLLTDLTAFLRDGGGPRGGGLRGGSWAVGGRGLEVAFRLRRLEYVPGVRISSNQFGEDEDVFRLRVDGPGRLDGRVTLVGDDTVLRARGVIGGRRFRTRVVLSSRFASVFGIEPGAATAAGTLRRLACARTSRKGLESCLPRRLARPRFR
jgi:hypothetical protein